MFSRVVVDMVVLVELCFPRGRMIGFVQRDSAEVQYYCR